MLDNIKPKPKVTKKKRLSNSIYEISWPEKPVVEPYTIRIIKTPAELNTFLDEVEAQGVFSFDYEAGATKAEKERMTNGVKKRRMKKLLELKEDYEVHLEIASTAVQQKAALKALTKREKEVNDEYEKEVQFYKEAAFDPARSEVCTISMCCVPTDCAVLFLGMEGQNSFKSGNKTSEEERELVFDILESRIFKNKNVVKVAYNIEYEAMQSTSNKAYIMKPVFDPLVAIARCSQIVKWDTIIDPKRPAAGKGLKDMAREYLGVEMTNFEDLLSKYEVEFFNDLSCDNDDAIKYAAEDSIYSLYLAEYWAEVAKQIPIEEGLYTTYLEWLMEIEMPFMRVIGQMRYHGMEWNEQKAEETYEFALQQQSDAKYTITEICDDICDKMIEQGIPEAIVKPFKGIDPGKTGKTKAVREFIFDVLNVPPAKKSKTTGDPSMDTESMLDLIFMVENNLQELKEEKYLGIKLGADPSRYLANELKAYRIQNRPDMPFKEEILDLLKAIMNMQKYGTLISSHIEGRKKYVNPFTHRIHCKYTPWTETSRTNSSRPNGQNVPRPDNDPFNIRSLYKAPKGKVLILIDYSGFELRLMAWQSKDQTMLDLLNNGGDLHKMTASKMTGKPMNEITKPERSKAKAGNFGINYGGTEHSLQTTLKKMNVRLSLDECLTIVNAVKTAYPGIPKFQKDIARKASQDGFVSTIFGYKRVLPHINSSNKMLRSSDERRASNTPIQGSAADIMKRAQNDIYEFIGMNNLHGKVDMIAQIHDEVILEVDNDLDLIKETVAKVSILMEKEPFEGFPVKVEVEASITEEGWGDKIDFDKWLENVENKKK